MDANRLDYELAKHSISSKEMADRIGISISTYYKKRRGETEFTLNEMQAINDVIGYEATNKVFFAQTDPKNETSK